MGTWTNATPAELADAIRAALLLESEPVGVRIFRGASEFEAWPAEAPVAPVYYCSAVRMAAGGASLKLAHGDISCDTSPRTLGLEPGFHDDDFVGSYVAGGLYRDRAVAGALLRDVSVLEGTTGVAVAPLARFSAETPPDVIVVATDPYGIMRLLQAAAFHGHRASSDAIGMHGICAECTARPHLTGRVSVSLLCSGTRYIAGWEEHLMAAGIPGALLAEVVDGLVSTAERFECDARKAHMRAACGCRTRSTTRADDTLGKLADGAGYFCGE